jgi:hypothetical protein
VAGYAGRALRHLPGLRQEEGAGRALWHLPARTGGRGGVTAGEETADTAEAPVMVDMLNRPELLFNSFIEFGIALLEGENMDMQRSLFAKFCSGDTSQASFKVFQDMIEAPSKSPAVFLHDRGRIKKV